MRLPRMSRKGLHLGTSYARMSPGRAMGAIVHTPQRKAYCVPPKPDELRHFANSRRNSFTFQGRLGVFMGSLEELPSGGRNWRKVLTFTATLHYKRSLYKRLDFRSVGCF